MIRTDVFSISALIEEVAPAVRDQLAGKSATFSWRVADGCDEICTDRRKLQRIMAGLLGNSVKFTESGWISLTVAEKEDGRVEFTVADTGIGIPSSDLAIVFEQFRQLDGSFTRRYGGLGLGLTLARELILLLGGEMVLESHVGEGTTVRVLLPRSIGGRRDQRAVAPPPAARPGAPLSRLLDSSTPRSLDS